MKVKWHLFKIKSGIIILLSIILISSAFENLFSQSDGSDDKQNYSFNYDQEIPTLIRYGSKVDGIFSKSAYLGFIVREDNNSRSSIDIGYNVTVYKLISGSFDRAFSIFMPVSYTPFLFEYFSISDPSNMYIEMLSPIVGYSYSQSLSDWFGFECNLNGGPVYSRKISKYKNEKEFGPDYEYTDYLESYEAMHDVSGHWGGRINPKIKLYLRGDTDTLRFGLNFGYTQFVFAHNHFNSYDIGINFSFFF